jgi:hypothetical protein
MRWMVFVLVGGVALAGVVASMAPASPPRSPIPSR